VPWIPSVDVLLVTVHNPMRAMYESGVCYLTTSESSMPHRRRLIFIGRWRPVIVGFGFGPCYVGVVPDGGTF
jgi:hypothetical protein